MHTKTEKSPRRRYSEDQIISLLDQFDNGNVSLKTFSNDHGISDTTLYNWRKRYLNRKVNDRGNFIEVVPATPAVEIPDSTGGLFAEIRGINIYQPVSAAYLKALIS
jgi:transposase-like protein